MENTETRPMRAGEELSRDNLIVYLQGELGTSSDEAQITQFPGGASNLTYLIQIGAEEFVLRRPPFGNTVKSAHDMGREFRVLSALSKVYSPAPRPVAFCDDVNVIGAEFYLMERRRGVILRDRVPDALTTASKLQKKVCQSLIDNLAALHNLDYQEVGLADLGKPEGYARRQVEGWTKRYFAAKTDEHSELEAAVEWLNQSIPPETGASLVHNDYKFDNVMLADDDLTRIVAVLDWEMCTIGDPLMDLGTTLGYWMSEDAPAILQNLPSNPAILMRSFTRSEIAERYAEATERDIGNILFYYVFGTFKIAVIAQQIYARFAKGLTQDKRFAHFNEIVGALGEVAARGIETGKV